MTIKAKLTAMMMGIAVATVLLTASSIMAYVIYDVRQSKLHELEVTAAITADRNSAALMFLDNERAQKNLDIFHLNTAVLMACLYDVSGQLFAGYQTVGPCPATQKEFPAATPGMLTADKEIRQNNEHIGSVFIISDTRAIDIYIHKIIMIGISVTALVLAWALMLTIYFQRAISEPILKLASTARRITDSRDYSLEAPKTYKGEAGALADAFNAMLTEVRKRDEELRNANETLEQKVQQRTQQLEDARLRAEKANEAKSEFLRNMSHEFRTPLHALVSFAAYGTNEHSTAPREQLKYYFELIQTSANRLTRLVNEVLDLAKLEHGDCTYTLRRTDLYELTAKSVELVQSLLKEKDITLELRKPQAQTTVVCDQDKIVQVITNLLGNAIKFTPKGKHITLEADALQTRDGQAMQVAVIDEGIGVPEGEHEAIFESFRQSSRTNTGAGGTGLGLAICRHIVTAHGGRIWAENNENHCGARVTFVIPASLQEGRKIVASNGG